MIAMKLGWLLLEAVFLGFFLYTGHGLAFVGLLAAIPLCTLPGNLYIRRGLRLRVEPPAAMRKGERGSLQIVLENPTILPVLRCTCRVTVENQLNRSVRQLTLSSSVMPKRTQTLELQIGDAYCGRCRIEVTGLRLYDCFGLIGIPGRCTAVGHTTVRPDTFEPEIVVRPCPSSAEESDIFSPDKPGSDLTETFQIREYVPGDSPRQIHWKLTGKFDRLIVRDPSLPITRSVMVFWERTGESGDPAQIDAQAEVVISLCESLLDQSIQFTIGWNDTDRTLCVLQEIHDLDELIGIIPRILRATGTREGVSGAQLLQSTCGDLPAHLIYIAEEPQNAILEFQAFCQVTMLLCGETQMADEIRFDASNYQTQLMQIEI